MKWNMSEYVTPIALLETLDDFIILLQILYRFDYNNSKQLRNVDRYYCPAAKYHLISRTRDADNHASVKH